MKILKLIIFSTILTSIINCSNKNNKHLGEWNGKTDDGQLITLILLTNDDVVLTIDNSVLADKSSMFRGKEVYNKYKIDYTKNPIQLNILGFLKGSNKKTGEVKGSIKFITDNKIYYKNSIGFNFIFDRKKED